jgi:hypothetical protein
MGEPLLTDEQIDRIRKVIDAAHPGLELYLRWDGHIAECGAGPEIAEADVVLFQRAPSLLRDVLADRDSLRLRVAELEQERDRHAIGDEDYRSQLHAIKVELGLAGGGVGLSVAKHAADLKAQRDLAVAECERLKAERDELHAALKAVVDYAIDVIGVPVARVVHKAAPLEIVRKLHQDLQHAASENLAFNIKVASEINEARSQRARHQRILDLARRWCTRPEDVLREGATVLANDAEMWRKLRAAVEEASKP